MPIPDRLNVTLTVLVFGAAMFLLWLGSWVSHFAAVLGVGIVYSYLLLTNYALLHEAAHGNCTRARAGTESSALFVACFFPAR